MTVPIPHFIDIVSSAFSFLVDDHGFQGSSTGYVYMFRRQRLGLNICLERGLYGILQCDVMIDEKPYCVSDCLAVLSCDSTDKYQHYCVGDADSCAVAVNWLAGFVKRHIVQFLSMNDDTVELMIQRIRAIRHHATLRYSHRTTIDCADTAWHQKDWGSAYAAYYRIPTEALSPAQQRRLEYLERRLNKKNQ